MKKYCVGVDVGGTTVKLGVFLCDGTLLKKWEIPTNKEDHGAKIVPDIASSIQENLQAEGIAYDAVEGIGMGVPGPVLEDGTVNRCVNLGWGVFCVKKALEEATGLPVTVGNDATVAAVGEAWQGGGKGYSSVVMITLGTGVGGGIVLHGKPWHGVHGAGGEIGHMFVVPEETEVCGCGKKGCLEQVASATGIVKEARKALASSMMPSALRGVDPLTARDVCDAAKAGDELARGVLEKLGHYLGLAMSHIAEVIDPEAFVIGGGVSKAGKILIDVSEKYFKEYSFHACRSAVITLATLGNDAGIYGAARMVIDEE